MLRYTAGVALLTMGASLIGYVLASIAARRLGRLQRWAYLLIGLGTVCSGPLLLTSDAPSILFLLVALFTVSGSMLELRSCANNESGRQSHTPV